MSEERTGIALRGQPPPLPPPLTLREQLDRGADWHAGSVMLAARLREATSPTIGKAA